MSALLMDQLLGSAAAAAGLWGMTAHLELDYRGPLPLETPLVLRGRVAENEGRKSRHHRHDRPGRRRPTTVLVEARGVFVAAAPGEARGLLRRRSPTPPGSTRPPRRPGDADGARRRTDAVMTDVEVAAAAGAAPPADVLLRAARPRA